MAPQFDLTAFVLGVIAFFFTIAIHEANHAFVATALGDDTPRRAGRLTLNPFRHIDKNGMIMYMVTSLIGWGIGWGWTPVNPSKMKPNPRVGNAIVAAAGPLANLALAFACSLPIRAGMDMPHLVYQFLMVATFLNLLLFVFNLLPVPPLDGFSVLLGILPASAAAPLQRLQQYGLGPLMVLVFLLPLLGFNVLGIFLHPVCRAFALPGLSC
jgi:Zn-dependent protease